MRIGMMMVVMGMIMGVAMIMMMVFVRVRVARCRLVAQDRWCGVCRTPLPEGEGVAGGDG